MQRWHQNSSSALTAGPAQRTSDVAHQDDAPVTCTSAVVSLVRRVVDVSSSEANTKSRTPTGAKNRLHSQSLAMPLF
jgi:hypothetical protein